MRPAALAFQEWEDEKEPARRLEGEVGEVEEPGEHDSWKQSEEGSQDRLYKMLPMGQLSQACKLTSGLSSVEVGHWQP